MLYRFYVCNPNLLLFKYILEKTHILFLFKLTWRLNIPVTVIRQLWRNPVGGFTFTTQTAGLKVRKGPEKNASSLRFLSQASTGRCVIPHQERNKMLSWTRVQNDDVSGESLGKAQLSSSPSLLVTQIHHGCRRASFTSKAHSPQHMRSWFRVARVWGFDQQDRVFKTVRDLRNFPCLPANTELDVSGGNILGRVWDLLFVEHSAWFCLLKPVWPSRSWAGDPVKFTSSEPKVKRECLCFFMIKKKIELKFLTKSNSKFFFQCRKSQADVWLFKHNSLKMILGNERQMRQRPQGPCSKEGGNNSAQTRFNTSQTNLWKLAPPSVTFLPLKYGNLAPAWEN